MGAIFAKFRKEKTTTEVLERLEEKIKAIEKYSLSTQEQKKRFVGSFLAISIGIYIIAVVVCYFVYFPQTWKERILYTIPMLLIPIIILLLRKALTWYFEKKLDKNTQKLTALRAEKRKILEQVMDKETYKVAVELLNRFSDRANGNRPLYGMTPRMNVTHSARINNVLTSTPTLRTNTGLTANSKPGAANTSPVVASSLTNLQISGIQTRPASPRPLTEPNLLREQRSLPNLPPRTTPFPILNLQDRSVFERIVDILVADGPQDRFAMICRNCHAHNGMAPKDDYEYTTYRCAFCDHLNQSQKSRPIAPRLSTNAALLPPHRQSSDSSSSDDSDNLDTVRQRHLSLPSVDMPPLHLQETEEAEISSTGNDGDDEGTKTERTLSDAESRRQARQEALLNNDADTVESLLKGELKKDR